MRAQPRAAAATIRYELPLTGPRDLAARDAANAAGPARRHAVRGRGGVRCAHRRNTSARRTRLRCWPCATGAARRTRPRSVERELAAALLRRGGIPVVERPILRVEVPLCDELFSVDHRGTSRPRPLRRPPPHVARRRTRGGGDGTHGPQARRHPQPQSVRPPGITNTPVRPYGREARQPHTRPPVPPHASASLTPQPARSPAPRKERRCARQRRFVGDRRE